MNFLVLKNVKCSLMSKKIEKFCKRYITDNFAT